ncbi:hypothetical protein QO058_01240 [Bosea vestrisii]|nr:hypothetical protein [Bosea vestrisii]WID96943.1 hypothetical protein QO058_01240 [Bosea vestrisii]
MVTPVGLCRVGGEINHAAFAGMRGEGRGERVRPQALIIQSHGLECLQVLARGKDGTRIGECLGEHRSADPGSSGEGDGQGMLCAIGEKQTIGGDPQPVLRKPVRHRLAVLDASCRRPVSPEAVGVHLPGERGERRREDAVAEHLRRRVDREVDDLARTRLRAGDEHPAPAHAPHEPALFEQRISLGDRAEPDAQPIGEITVRWQARPDRNAAIGEILLHSGDEALMREARRVGEARRPRGGEAHV